MTEQRWTQDDYRTAIRFAAEAHQGQTVTDTGLPYLLHVSLVAMEVIAALRAEAGHDERLAVQCALLHDVLEDTAVGYGELRERFGAAVADGVAALSKDPALPSAERMADSLARIGRQPGAVALVKLADRITNLQPPPRSWSAAKVAAYRDEATAILTALGGASPALAERLRDHIAAYGVRAE